MRPERISTLSSLHFARLFPIPQGGIGREDRLFLLHGDVQRYAMHIGEEGEYCVRIVQGEHVLCPRDTYAGAQ